MAPTGLNIDLYYLTPNLLFLRKLGVCDPKRTVIMPNGNGCVDLVCELPDEVADVAPFVGLAKPSATILMRRAGENHLTRVPCTVQSLRREARYIDVLLMPSGVYAADLFADKSRVMASVCRIEFDAREGRAVVANPAWNPHAKRKTGTQTD